MQRLRPGYFVRRFFFHFLSSRFLIAAFTALAGACAHAASFDCTLAQTSREKTICANADLSQKDEQLAALYAQARDTLSTEAFATIQANQRTWLHSLDQRCLGMIGSFGLQAYAGCLGMAYDTRIKQLNAVLDAARQETEKNREEPAETEPQQRQQAQAQPEEAEADQMQTQQQSGNATIQELEQRQAEQIAAALANLNELERTAYNECMAETAGNHAPGESRQIFCIKNAPVAARQKEEMAAREQAQTDQQQVATALANLNDAERIAYNDCMRDRMNRIQGKDREITCIQNAPDIARQKEETTVRQQAQASREQQQAAEEKAKQDAARAQQQEQKQKQEARSETITKIGFLVFIVCFLVLLIGGLTDKFVVFYDKKDLIITAMVPLSLVIGLILNDFFAPSGANSDTPKTFIQNFILYGSYLSSVIFTIWTIGLSVRYNRNLLLGIVVGIFKVMIALFLALITLIGMLPDEKRSKRGSTKLVAESVGFAIVLAAAGWLVYKLINGERVYQERNWEPVQA